MYTDYTSKEDTALLDSMSALTLQEILSKQQEQAKGIRLSFMLGAALAVVALFFAATPVLLSALDIGRNSVAFVWFNAAFILIAFLSGALSIGFNCQALFSERPKLNGLKLASLEDIVTLKQRLDHFEKDDMILVSLTKMQRVFFETKENKRVLTVGEVAQLNVMLSRWEAFLALAKSAKATLSGMDAKHA